ncbi:unnamed protein product [Cyprideis torosa]|uniref:Selenoprotein F n=1 Tax=Cyprideis torosa TaxID=163714 RepID=A0A7R8W6E1_9CRUS|nr:unnamed protein product [Cyprideis torosa]CAG0880929.1 unnamed protein product [Cyprideis torosa]
MILMTMIARVLDGLPLAASIQEDDQVPSVLSELASLECSDLGFDKSSLLCSSCSLLPHFDLQPLIPHCRECCIDDGAGEDGDSGVKRKYPRAILEVSFVKSERPRRFPGLQIVYKRGADPVIKLMDAVGNIEEELAVDQWDTDSVEEFLLEYLESNEL